MDTRLFEVDPYAGVAYGMYAALKKSDASFEDFLLHYDSHSVNEGDNAWLTKLARENMSNALGTPEVLEAMDLLGVGNLDLLSSASFFDTQTSAYRLQLLQAMHERGESLSDAQKQFYQNLDTIIP